MDLYIQIGVIFLMLAAFSTFTYFYTEPVEMFSSSISESSEEININLDKIENRYLQEFNNNPAVPGTSVETLVKQAGDKKIAVFLQTKNQNTLVVNYGYQLRHSKNIGQKLTQKGTSDVSGGPSDFESSYSTGISSLFGSANSTSPPRNIHITSGGFLDPNSNTSSEMWVVLGNTGNDLYAHGSALQIKTAVGGSAYPEGPHIMLFEPLSVTGHSKDNGNTYYNKGHLYTDQTLRENQLPNINYSFLDSPTSVYYLDRNSSYYATLIVDVNREVVGVYIEEHGVRSQSNVLARAMQRSNLITEIY